MGRIRVAFAILVLLAPSACASSVDDVSWTSGAPIALEGKIEARAARGVLEIEDAHANGTFVIDVGNGTTSVSSWRVAKLDVPRELGRYAPPTEDATNDSYSVRASRMIVELHDEPLKLTLVASEDAAILLAGEGRAEGLPVRLAAPYVGYPLDRSPASSAQPFRAPGYVDWSWDAGWLFAGHFRVASPSGFPDLAAPRVHLQGPIALMITGGTVTFEDVAGERHVAKLGNVTDPDDPGAPVASYQRETRLLFYGEARDASIEPSGNWGLAGPDVAWRVNGTLAAERATGSYHDAGGEHVFTDEPFVARGDLRVRSLGADAATLRDERYDARGDFASFVVGGVEMARDGSSWAPAVALSVTAAGLLLLLFALYTRLAPNRLLDHAARQALHGIVAAEPGIHMREAGRRAELPWGTLRFHVRMLRRAGIVRVEAEGRSLRLYPAGVACDGPPPIYHPVARGIMERLPVDGTPVDLRTLQEAVGTSRQRLSYHLKKLAAEGRVSLVGGRPILVARPVPALEAKR